MDKTQKQFKGFKSNLSSGLKTFGKLTGLAIGAKALVDFGKAAIEVASDITEVQNVVDVTFGSMAKDVNEFASSSIKEFGLSTLAAKEYSSSMGAMLKSSGIAGEAVRDMSIDLAKLSADMASFYNLENDEAFRKIMSGMSGMTQPLKELGINMNIANLEYFAMQQGIQKSWQEMNQAEQTMLRYNYLLNVTKDSQGDFARNANTWANQVKILKMQWEEFMSLIGKALVEILLPVVKFLNKVLELLIKIARSIGSIYTMITGKEVTVETNTNIADTAFDAAEGENKLADGIGKAAKAAKKALAPFDELNILQDSLGAAGNGSGGLPGTIGDGGLNTIMSTNKVDDGWKIKIDDEEPKKFFIWFTDKWNGLKQMLSIPLMAVAPIFQPIPNPIYEPNWGLTPPLVPSPVFEPIRNPVYEPNWNLEVPKVASPVFQPIPNPIYEPVWNLVPPPVPAVEYGEYVRSLETMRTRTSEIFEGIRIRTEGTVEGIKTSVVSKYESMKEWTLEHTENLRQKQAELWGNIREETEMETGRISTGLVTAWATNESNFNVHKENMGIIAAAISAVLVTNINQGLYTMGKNVNTTINTVQTNLETFGKNVGTIAAEIAESWAKNLNEGFDVTSQNFSTFANTVGENLKSFGTGFLEVAAETSRGFVNNMVSGFAKVWENFKGLMEGLGERVSGWWSENRSMVLKTAITAGVVVGAGGLALAAPAAIPYVAGALGGLASIPALAKGVITNGPMLAMIGDNPGGKEVVSPLDKLQDMLVSAVGTALLQSEQFDIGNREPIVVQVNLEGREIAKAVYDPLQDEKTRRGDDPIIQPI